VQAPGLSAFADNERREFYILPLERLQKFEPVAPWFELLGGQQKQVRARDVATDDALLPRDLSRDNSNSIFVSRTVGKNGETPC
jgi:hypothetical protein